MTDPGNDGKPSNSSSSEISSKVKLDGLATVATLTPLSTEDRFVGSLLCGLIGDALGAAVEGYGWQEIAKTHKEVTDYIEATHMGVRHLGKRIGMFTDDGNATLALLTSLVEEKSLHPVKCARKYAEFWRTTPERGCPQSAQAVMTAV